MGVIYRPKEGETVFHVEFDGKHEWKGEYVPNQDEWLFTRTPEVAEMPKRAPDWAKDAVKGKLQWRLVLKVDQCGKLKGKWYPGFFKWEEVKDKKTGKVLFNQSKAVVPNGQEGWGTPTDVKYTFVDHFETH